MAGGVNASNMALFCTGRLPSHVAHCPGCPRTIACGANNDLGKPTAESAPKRLVAHSPRADVSQLTSCCSFRTITSSTAGSGAAARQSWALFRYVGVTFQNLVEIHAHLRARHGQSALQVEAHADLLLLSGLSEASFVTRSPYAAHLHAGHEQRYHSVLQVGAYTCVAACLGRTHPLRLRRPTLQHLNRLDLGAVGLKHLLACAAEAQPVQLWLRP